MLAQNLEFMFGFVSGVDLSIHMIFKSSLTDFCPFTFFDKGSFTNRVSYWNLQ